MNNSHNSLKGTWLNEDYVNTEPVSCKINGLEILKNNECKSLRVNYKNENLGKPHRIKALAFALRTSYYQVTARYNNHKLITSFIWETKLNFLGH